MAADENLGLLDNLVTQFSSSLDCFRELAQNSIDAGSPVVEVWTEYIAGSGYEGTIALHVDDWGEGMDENIIDLQLTRLFSSSKENDLTKIGKFGIGFVSVFALKPAGVLLQTGRGGEYWEVFFHEDRSFTKTRLDVPVEGTQITLFLRGDRLRYQELVREIPRTLSFWCQHADTEITFEDRTPPGGGFSQPQVINQPFEIEGRCVTRVSHQGTEIVMAFQTQPTYGFYNAGLTLAYTRAGEDVLGRRAARFRCIGFKIMSRYLEHTLSRETIMRDDNYEKAMRLLEAAVDGELFEALLGAIEDLVARPTWGRAEVDAYEELMGFLAAQPMRLVRQAQGRSLFRVINRPGAQVGISLGELHEVWKHDGRILLSCEPTPLSDALHTQGVPVVYGVEPGVWTSAVRSAVSSLLTNFLRDRAEVSVLGWVRKLFNRPATSQLVGALSTPEEVYFPVVIEPNVSEEVGALIVAAAEILHKVDAGYREIRTCVVSQGRAQAPLFVVAPKLGTVMARPPVGFILPPRDGVCAALNRDHPHFLQMLDLWAHAPQIAAYCLAKSLLLTEGRLLEKDIPMISAAIS